MTKASMISRDLGRRVYEVTRDGRRWTVTHHVVRDDWSIENERRRFIDPMGSLGISLIAACEAEFSRLEPAE